MAAGASSPGDSRFFRRTGPYPLAVVASTAGGTLAPGHAADTLLHGVAPLQDAGPQDVAFLENRRYTDLLATTGAGAVIVQPALAPRLRPGCAAILTPEPRVGWARVAALFFPDPVAIAGRHPSAVVDPAAVVDPSAEIGPLAVIGAAARIGPRCCIGPGAVIGPGVVLGADCRVGAHASLSHTLAGDRVNILPGARIGQEGFGFEPTPAGFLTVPQLGRVILEDDVEIGANTTIDRGALGETRIGQGTKIDNLVQIGHNCKIGKNVVIASQVGISGSCVIEDGAILAGQVGLGDHVTIGKGVILGGQGGVYPGKTVTGEGEMFAGTPAEPVRDFLKTLAKLRRLK